MSEGANREAGLRALAAIGRQAWPELQLADDAFVRHALARVPPDVALDAIHAADLYLACGCSNGDRAALRLFEERLLTPLAPALARYGDAHGFVADLMQQLRVRLLVGPPPRIAEYAGRGALAAWVRVAAVRCAVDLKRREHAPMADAETDADAAALARAGDPELQVIKARYRGDFLAALRDAFASLDARERLLLRFYVVERMNIAEIGAIIGSSRATVGRRVIDCRAKILEATRTRLQARLRVHPSELSSLMRMVHSDLDISLSALLASPA